MLADLTYEQKIERSKSLVRESYYKASIIDQVVEFRNALVSDENFLKLYKRTYIPREWFIRKDIYSDIVFRQFGSNIAFSEKKYIVSEILKNEGIERQTVESIDSNTLVHTSRSLLENGFNPTVLFITIDFYTKLYIDWLRVNPELQVVPFGNISISGHEYKIFWSNKYMPFSEVIFIDRNFGKWISKPNFNERLSVRISESDREDQLDLLIFTTLKFEILNKDRMTILQTANEE